MKLKALKSLALSKERRIVPAGQEFEIENESNAKKMIDRGVAEEVKATDKSKPAPAPGNGGQENKAPDSPARTEASSEGKAPDVKPENKGKKSRS